MGRQQCVFERKNDRAIVQKCKKKREAKGVCMWRKERRKER